MFRKRVVSILLILSILISLVSVGLTVSSRTVNAQGIGYNESALHTFENESVQELYIGADATYNDLSIVADGEHGNVLKTVSNKNARVCFDDLDIIKDRRYYIYFDAKSDTDGAKLLTLIGTKTSSGNCRHFLTGYAKQDEDVQYYINGKAETSADFTLSTEWQHYGIYLDTSGESLLAAILKNGASYADFWNKEIHFLFGVMNATAYFDNIQLVEIDPREDAVPKLDRLTAAVSLRTPRSAIENNGAYLSAGLRFKGIISNTVKENADEIGFIVTPSAFALEDADWYDISNGVSANVRTGVCYLKGNYDIAYSVFDDTTAYQMILTGLSKENGTTTYIQRFSTVMYVRSGSQYTYYALGETSYNEVLGRYRIMDINAGNGIGGIELSLHGITEQSSLTVGDTLPTLDDIYSEAPARHRFLGWFTEEGVQRTTVSNTYDTLYGVYDGYAKYTFDSASIYNPNNGNYIFQVDDPFGGEGKVMHTPLSGNIRGIVPSVCDGIDTKGFEFKKDHTYRVSFYYRFAETDPSSAAFRLETWGVSDEGIYLSGSKEKIEYPSSLVPNCGTFKNTGDWTLCTFTVTNVTDHPYLYIRFLFTTSEAVHNLYVDNLTISDVDVYKNNTDVKLINNGKVEYTELAVGDTLPTPDAIYDEVTKASYTFDGWYDKTLTAKYTVVTEGVDEYYAKYTSLTEISFELGGLYDPNHRYANRMVMKSIFNWYRTADPTGADNICLKGILGNNGNNTHFSPSLVEGSTVGYTLTAGKKYVITYDYYISSNDPDVTHQSVGVRGAAENKIGYSGSKTDSLTSQTMFTVNKWASAALLLTASSDVADLPHLIITSQNSHYTDTANTVLVPELDLYLDNIRIMQLPDGSDIVIRTEAKNVTLNQNGEVTIYNDFNIGDDIPDADPIDGVEFIGWYNEKLNVPYKKIQCGNTTLYAKYDAAINTFENKALIDPNSNFSKNTRVQLTADPTDPDNTVMMVDLAGSVGNHHFALAESSYGSSPIPYRLTVGNTYTVSFRYYAEDLNEKGVSLQLRGCKKENVGISGGKSNSTWSSTVNTEGKWVTVSDTFTYKGTGIADYPDAYLVMLAQDASSNIGAASCTATVYFDDFIIKETVPEKTYTKTTIKIGTWTLGYANGRTHNIVVPSQNFSYLAMMQLEKLRDTIKGITATSCEFNIVKECDWTEVNNQSNIFIGDVTGHSRDNKYKIDTSSFTADDYAYSFGGGNIYVNGGSTQSLAMAISELAKQLEAAADGTTFAAGTVVSGKYSEAISSYSTKDYYRGTFVEDFDGEDINTEVWNEIEGSNITAALDGWRSKRSDEHTYIENGNLVIEADFNEEEKMFYGGMLKTHGKMEYRYGYLEVSCVTPHGAGLWTATWTNHNKTGTGFYSSEVDVNESFGNARYTNFNMHSWPTSAADNMGYAKYATQNVSGTSDRKADAGKEAGFNDGFHTFGFFWTPTGAKFTVDGFVQFEYNYDDLHKCDRFNGSITDNDYDAFNETLSVIVSMTVANPGTGGQVPDITADYWNTSNKYIVDYVHIYQIDGQDMFYYQ